MPPPKKTKYMDHSSRVAIVFFVRTRQTKKVENLPNPTESFSFQNITKKIMKKYIPTMKATASYRWFRIFENEKSVECSRVRVVKLTVYCTMLIIICVTVTQVFKNIKIN